MRLIRTFQQVFRRFLAGKSLLVNWQLCQMSRRSPVFGLIGRFVTTKHNFFLAKKSFFLLLQQKIFSNFRQCAPVGWAARIAENPDSDSFLFPQFILFQQFTLKTTQNSYTGRESRFLKKVCSSIAATNKKQAKKPYF